MNPLLQRLGWALLHSLWEGAAAWIALRFALVALRRRSAQARYLVACAALVGATVAPWVTFFRIDLAQRLVRTEVPALSRTATAPPAAATRSRVADANPAEVTGTPFAPVPPTRLSWADRVAPALPWLVFAWALGAIISAARLAAEWSKVRRLARASGSPLPPLLEPLFSRLCAAAGLAGRVTARVSDWVDVPTVIGSLKPLVLFPSATLLQLSPMQLEAVIAHELAHIRRHDFVVNLLQAIGETIFYYHPAVRAINRHIRVEREQACDDAAVAATGDRVAYAQALAALAELQAPALALAASGAPGTLLQRIRRLVGTESRGPSVGATALAAAGLYLVMLFAAPALTAKIMTAAERIRAIRAAVPPSITEQLAEVDGGSGTHGGTARPGGATMRVTGELRGPDGALLDRDFDLEAMSSRELSSTSVGLRVHHGRFDEAVPVGALWILCWPSGFTPVVAGPFLPARGTDAIPPITVPLKHGYPVRLRFAAPDGSPVAGVSVRGSVKEPGAPANGMLITLPAQTSGANGEITVRDADADMELHLDCRRPGFQTQLLTLRALPKNGVVDVSMATAELTTGRVVDADTGQPVPNAKIILAARSGSGDSVDEGWMGSLNYTAPGDLLATTDSEGQFSVNTLNRAWTYRVYVAATGYQPITESLASGQAAEYRLPPGVRVAGMVRGLPSRSVTLTCAYEMRVSPSWWSGASNRLVLTGNAPERAFAFDHLPPGDLTLRVAGTATELKVTAKSNLEDIVYDVVALHEHATRTQQVTITFDVPAGAPPALGEVQATYRRVFSTTAGERVPPYYAASPVGVRNGRVVLLSVAPGRLELRSDGLIGYWFAARTVMIDAATRTQTIRLAVVPAGAIRARATDAGGGLLHRSGWMQCIPVHLPPAVDPNTATALARNADEAAPDTFSFTPVPLGGTYRVVSFNQYNMAVSRDILVDAEHPLVDVDVPHARGEDMGGVVIDQDGAPVPDADVSFTYDPTPRSAISNSVSCDANGHFTLRGVNLDIPGTYYLNTGGGAWSGRLAITRDTPRPLRLVVHRVGSTAARARD